jgi:hypothetical protein
VLPQWRQSGSSPEAVALTLLVRTLDKTYIGVRRGSGSRHPDFKSDETWKACSNLLEEVDIFAEADAAECDERVITPDGQHLERWRKRLG